MRNSHEAEDAVLKTVLLLDRIIRLCLGEEGLDQPPKVMMSQDLLDELSEATSILVRATQDSSDLQEFRAEARDRLEQIRAAGVLEILGDEEVQRRLEEERGDEDDGANAPTECPVCEELHGGYEKLKDGVCVVCTYEQSADMAWFRRRDADIAYQMEKGD